MREKQSHNAGNRLVQHVQRVTHMSVMFGQQRPYTSQPAAMRTAPEQPEAHPSSTGNVTTHQPQPTMQQMPTQQPSMPSSIRGLQRQTAVSPHEQATGNNQQATGNIGNSALTPQSPIQRTPEQPTTNAPRPMNYPHLHASPAAETAPQQAPVQRQTAVSPHEQSTANNQQSTINSENSALTPQHSAHNPQSPIQRTPQPTTNAPRPMNYPQHHAAAAAETAPQQAPVQRQTAVSPHEQSTANNQQSTVNSENSALTPQHSAHNPQSPIQRTPEQPTTNAPQPMNYPRRHVSAAAETAPQQAPVQRQTAVSATNQQSTINSQQSTVNSHTPVQRTPEQPRTNTPQPGSAATNPEVQKFIAMSGGVEQTNLPWNSLQAMNRVHRQANPDTHVSQQREMPWVQKKREIAAAKEQPPQRLIRRSKIEEISTAPKKNRINSSPTINTAVLRQETPDTPISQPALSATQPPSPTPIEPSDSESTITDRFDDDQLSRYAYSEGDNNESIPPSAATKIAAEVQTANPAPTTAQRKPDSATAPNYVESSSTIDIPTAEAQRPLQEAWPVQRLETPVNIPADENDTSIYDPPAKPTAVPVKTSGEAKQVKQLMQKVAAEKTSDSSVDFVMPTRPRPTSAHKSDTSTVAAQQPVQRSVNSESVVSESVQSQSRPPHSPMHNDSVATEPETIIPTNNQPVYRQVSTEIGTLPSDLWELVGDTPPDTTATSKPTSPAPASPTVNRQAVPETRSKHKAPLAGQTAVSPPHAPVQKTAVPQTRQSTINSQQSTVNSQQSTIVNRQSSIQRADNDSFATDTGTDSDAEAQESDEGSVDMEFGTDPPLAGAETGGGEMAPDAAVGTDEWQTAVSDTPFDDGTTAQADATDPATEADSSFMAYIDETRADELSGSSVPLTMNRQGQPEKLTAFADADAFSQVLETAGEQETSDSMALYSNTEEAELNVDDAVELMLQQESREETGIAFASETQIDNFLAEADTQEEDAALAVYADEETADSQADSIERITVRREDDNSSYTVFVNGDKLEDFLAQAEAESQDGALAIYADEETASEEVDITTTLLVQEQGERTRFLVYADTDRIDEFLSAAETEDKGPALTAYAEEDAAEEDLENPVPIIIKRIDDNQIVVAHVDEELLAEFVETAVPYEPDLLLHTVAHDVYAMLKRTLIVERERQKW